MVVGIGKPAHIQFLRLFEGLPGWKDGLDDLGLFFFHA